VDGAKIFTGFTVMIRVAQRASASQLPKKAGNRRQYLQAISEKATPTSLYELSSENLGASVRFADNP
jgi:hypothetical protein